MLWPLFKQTQDLKVTNLSKTEVKSHMDIYMNVQKKCYWPKHSSFLQEQPPLGGTIFWQQILKCGFY